MIGELYDPRKEFGKIVTEMAEENKNIVVFSADSGKSSGFGDFIKKYPKRYFECGIMEQGVVGMAAGMAATGQIPVFCAIAPFVTCRPYEMIRNDIGYMGQNVKLVGRNCGLTYSDLGSTHQSLDDFGLMRLIPGMTILAPQDPIEIQEAAKAMIAHKGPVYMRIGNPKIPQLFERRPFIIGKGERLKEGTDVTIITTGSTTRSALEALPILEKKGISAELLGFPTVVPLDRELVRASAAKTGKVITVEEHYIEGGLGTLVAEELSDIEHNVLKRIAVPMDYGKTCGDYEKLLQYYHLDSQGIAEAAEAFLK
ncbi:MAG: transketolase C-terminal domain-containing protein [Eubacteriales bacterium]|nr:transketolase C-terminal domain-containing protein [Eubacteriales bacterium]